MSISIPNVKNNFSLLIKLKSLHLLNNSSKNEVNLNVNVFYDIEDEEKIKCIPERVHSIETFNNEYNFVFKVSVNKCFYLPFICLKGKCPNFIHITFVDEDGKNKERKKLGLKIYLNKKYSFLKCYSSYKTYNVYECNNNNVKGYVELACEIVSCEHPLEYFPKKNKKMDNDDYFSLATDISISKLKKEMIICKTDKDMDTHIESYNLENKDNNCEKSSPYKRNILEIFSSSFKNAYKKMPIPLITTSNLVDILLNTMLVQYRRNGIQNPPWLKIINDAYDLHLFKHFQLCNNKKDYQMYEEIRTCSLFLYLDSVFLNTAAQFSKYVIIQEYTKYTNPRYVNKLLKGKLHHKIDLGHNFIYEKIVDDSPLDMLKLFKNDEIYVTKDSGVIGEGLIGILIFGDEKTDAEKAYKIYNREIKAQQWLNKGIAKIKMENMKCRKNIIKEKRESEWISLSLLSFNMGTVVSYKGFKMYVIPLPQLPLNITKLNNIKGNLKYEMSLLEKNIPTYNLLKNPNVRQSFIIPYYKQNNYVFFNINCMMFKWKNNSDSIFTHSELDHLDIESNHSARERCYNVPPVYSNLLKVQNNICLYKEISDDCKTDKERYEKKVDIYLEKIVIELEKVHLNVPFDSVSLKMYLQNKGLRIRHLGRMLKFITYKWLYNIITYEIFIRCIKKFIFLCMREMSIFYKKKVMAYIYQYRENNKKNEIKKMREKELISNLLRAHKSSKEKKKMDFSYFNEKGNQDINIKSNYNDNNNNIDELLYDTEASTCSNNTYDDNNNNNMFNYKKREDNNKMNQISDSLLHIYELANDKNMIENRLKFENVSLLSVIFNFDIVRKYTNKEMYILKRVNEKKRDVIDNYIIIKKIYKGNISLIDMLIINIFNILLTTKNYYYKNIFLLEINKLCYELYKINISYLCEEIQDNYIYDNLQKVLGILYFPSLLEYDEEIKKGNKIFHLYDLKSYNIRIKRSLNIYYIDFVTNRYIFNYQNIHLDISIENKRLLSILIFYTLVYYYNNNNINKNYLYMDNLKWEDFERVLLQSDKQKKYFHKIYDEKINLLLTSKDNITLFNNRDYFTFYGLLNIVAEGIKMRLFKMSMNKSFYLFRCISENSVMSIYIRLMWLSIYMFLRYYISEGCDLDSPHKKDDICIKDLRIRNGSSQNDIKGMKKYVKDKEQIKKKNNNNNKKNDGDDDDNDDNDDNDDLLLKRKKKIFFKVEGDDTTCESTIYSDNINEKCLNYNSDNSVDIYEKDMSMFEKINVYKKTYEICSIILKNYFVYYHPLYLDFYLSFAWYNKGSNNEQGFLHFLREFILLQINVCSKSCREKKMEILKMNENLEHLVFSIIFKNNKEDENNKNKYDINENMNIKRMDNYDCSSFLNDICYPHFNIYKDNKNYDILKDINFLKSNTLLASSLHYFINCLFYYYNNDEYINKYKSSDFIYDSIHICINSMESVKRIYRLSSNTEKDFGNACLDISLMIIILKLNHPNFLVDKNNWMLYALQNGIEAEQVLKQHCGDSHIDTIKCRYILGLIYIYFNNFECMHMLENVFYHIHNYEYTYEDNNILSSIFWYIPDKYKGSLNCMNRQKLILDKRKIKCYLFYMWLNIFIPLEYSKKIMNILFMLYSMDIYKKKKKGKSHDKDNTFFKQGKIDSYEQIILFIKNYKYIYKKDDLFLNLKEYDHLLRSNEEIYLKKKEEKGGKNETDEHNIYNIYNNNIHNIYSNNNIHYYMDGVNYFNNSLDESKNFKMKKDIDNKDILFYLHNEKKNKEYNSITSFFLKEFLDIVEIESELLYDEEKYLNEYKSYTGIQKKTKMYSLLHKLLKIKEKIKNRNKKNKGCDNYMGYINKYNDKHSYFDDNKSYNKIKQINSITEYSDKDSLSFLNSNKTWSDTSSNYTVIVKNISDNIKKKNKKNNNNNNDNNTFHSFLMHYDYKNKKRNKVKKSKIKKDINIFMSIMYYFLNYESFQKFYMKT
ncbi:conserved Plasmodium protein, unknown function [Plasmodium sp. gorilla clade G2]|uniref:conserved Plasmodium protein, unknown function n=1 Tax=Plasmodium sp. gorilla clade G2 TaxID=880535 RepID=UPI000D2275C8|nr:conserved Plasmodium protein, unknown function [Plasmodium sp. gorilla clade G2]SOV14040.1 conserved Plasmodium protein, unknown function [Plasmodium sp. gorilla clade G2]